MVLGRLVGRATLLHAEFHLSSRRAQPALQPVRAQHEPTDKVWHGAFEKGITENLFDSTLAQQDVQQRALEVEAIFGLVEYRLGVGLEGLIGNLVIAVCGEAV